MRGLILAVLIFGYVHWAACQDPSRYDPTSSYSIFTEYSNDSSRILIGGSQNRRLFALGADYERRLTGRSAYSWRYQVEVVPIELLQNPRLTTTVTNAVIGYPSSTDFPLGTEQYSAFVQEECVSGSGSGTYYDLNAEGQEVPVGTYTYTAVCSNPWTYGGGISPLGQRVNFVPRRRVQPYLAANAGFVAFVKSVPADSATMFNFSFEFGGGVEWYAHAGRGWTLDYRFHHISNAGRGISNPGVDNGTFRLAYNFWR